MVAQRENVARECTWTHEPNQSFSPRERIASHCHFGLNKMVDSTAHLYMIILEDDLHVAKDFANFMLAFLPLLRESHRRDYDSKLVCISGWNDNGASPLLCNPRRISRTTFFPGLGWAISRRFWTDVLREKWPTSSSRESKNIVGIGWDFWLRSEFEKQGWSCITPDVPRVFHFGSGGANVGNAEKSELFDNSKLAAVERDELDWSSIVSGEDITVTDMQRSESLRKLLQSSTVIHDLTDDRIKDFTCEDQFSRFAVPRPQRLPTGKTKSPQHFLLLYRRENYSSLASLLRLWPTPRGHFHHVLSVYLTHQRVLHLADVRRSRLIPQKFIEQLPEDVSLQPAEIGVSCDTHCRPIGSCSATGMELANTCQMLKKIFQCRDCAYETGPDLPAFVPPDAGGDLATEGLCLVAETGDGQGGVLDCSGSFPWTRRLCACAVQDVPPLFPSHDEL